MYNKKHENGGNSAKNNSTSPYKKNDNFKRTDNARRDEGGSSFKRNDSARRDEGGSSFKRNDNPRRDEGGSSFKRNDSPRRDESGSSFKRNDSPRRDEGGSSFKRYDSARRDEGGSSFKRNDNPRRDEGGSSFKKNDSARRDEGGSSFKKNDSARRDEGGSSFKRYDNTKRDEGGSSFKRNDNPRRDEGGSSFKRYDNTKRDEGGSSFKRNDSARRDEGGSSFKRYDNTKRDEGGSSFKRNDSARRDEGGSSFKRNDSAINNEKNDELDFQDSQTTLIIGRNPVIEALKSDQVIDTLYVNNESGGSISLIIRMAKEKDIVVKNVSDTKLDFMSHQASHQGVIASCGCARYVEVEEILAIAKEKNEPPFIIICDEIEDPHNLGAIIRTAEASGAHGIIIPKRRSASLNSTVYRTSAGAASWLPVARVSNIAATIDLLKENGVWIYGTDSKGESYTDVDIKGSIAIVIGSEGNGLGRLISEKCDFLLKLPMNGKITSLNASVAAGIFMYEVVRQKQISNK